MEKEWKKVFKRLAHKPAAGKNLGNLLEIGLIKHYRPLSLLGPKRPVCVFNGRETLNKGGEPDWDSSPLIFMSIAHKKFTGGNFFLPHYVKYILRTLFLRVSRRTGGDRPPTTDKVAPPGESSLPVPQEILGV